MNIASGSIKPILIRQIADSLSIFIACYLSNIYFLSNSKITEIIIPTISLFTLLIVIFIPTFYFLGIYTFVRSINSNTKAKKIMLASIISGFFLVAVFTIFNNYFQQNFTFSDIFFSDISVAWLLSVIGIITSRFLVNSYLRSKSNTNEFKQDRNKILIIGGAGYIGSSLLKQLLEKGYKVRILDLFLFGEEPISDVIKHKDLEIIKGDFRKIDDLVLAISGCYAVVHLGGIVGDPACSVDENLTREVNLTASKTIGQIAKSSGVEKFIFASSCSVYGAQDSILNEESKTNPLSLYARTKIASEKVLQDLSDIDFKPIFLRFGTVFGFSGRTRFDLVANLLTAHAFYDKRMTVFGKDQIRPFVHVDDAARSVVCALQSNLNMSEKLVFNIGNNDLNVTLFELAQKIQQLIPDSEIIEESMGDDARNYHVSFEKAGTHLGFKTKWSLDQGIQQVIEKLDKGEIEDYASAKHSNVKHLNKEGLKVLNEEDVSDWETMLLEESYT